MRPFFREAALIGTKGLTALVVILVGGIVLLQALGEETIPPRTPDECNIAVVPIVGQITTIDEDNLELFTASADRIVGDLERAEKDEQIRGVMVRIDSPGGNVIASRLVMDAIRRMTKPTVALIREMGTSGAYLAASGADQIVAFPDSDVGSLAVTMSYVQNAAENEQAGREYIQLSSGKFKDAGDPNRVLTAEERAIFERNIDEAHRLLVETVAENRNVPVASILALADGSTMLGTKAKEGGLVDQLGNKETAKTWLREKIETDVVYCDVE